MDFISKRVEEIKQKKARVSTLATNAKAQLKQTQKTLVELDQLMLDAFKDELGERKWDEEKGTYTRALHSEEKRLVADMERVLNRCRETMDKVVGGYLDHLEETAQKPLTYNTPDEDAKLDIVMQTKEEYKVVRTLYSDVMIDADSELATGGAADSSTNQKVRDAKKEYEKMSERLCEDALKYEHIYREELAQRVSGHFLAEQHLLRGVSSAMKDFIPYTRGLTLDWEEMRETRRTNLAAMKRGGFDDEDDNMTELMNSSLPRTETAESSKRDGIRKEKSANPFGGVASDISHSASNAANAIGNAGKSASKSISDIVANYGAKSAAKSAAKGAGLK